MMHSLVQWWRCLLAMAMSYYGQLENVDVAVGDTVRQGQIIGTVSTPTRFYSIEGSHLNFRVTRDGEPVDPLDYLD